MNPSEWERQKIDHAFKIKLQNAKSSLKSGIYPYLFNKSLFSIHES